MTEDKPMAYFELWLKKAGEDELAAGNLLEAGGPFSLVCFHCQQMAEKLLKGLLVFCGQEFEKIHDLLKLAGMLSSQFADVADLLDDLKYLNKLYIQARYVGDYPEFTNSEAKEALEHALRVKNFVLRKIGI